MSEYPDAMAVVAGTYRPPDLPFALWKVHPCGERGDPARFCVSRVGVGEPIHLECADPFSRLGDLCPDRCAR